MVRALAEARDTAYKGVVKPVEGTILTVAKDLAAAAEETLAETQDPIAILERCVPAADELVNRTPELLPVLKQAGVVDSGRQRFVSLSWKECCAISKASLSIHRSQPSSRLSSLNFENAMEGVEEGQDYEVVVDFFPNDQFELQKFYSKLEAWARPSRWARAKGCTACTSTCRSKNAMSPSITS